MAVDFSISGYESLFKKALRDGINIFCGAGFSVEAEDGNEKKLPTGIGLLRELQEEFPAIEKYTKLPRACTKLIQTDKTAFYSYLEKRFSVRKFSEKYLSLLNVNIRNIYTTNIDDLFFEIYKKSDKTFYLNDKSSNGEVFDDEYAINYYPLHGCVRGNREYVFGATEIACAFLKSDLRKSWSCLATDASRHPILFWGWNFEDTGPIEAMYGNNNQIEENINKWVLLYEKDEEMIDYLRTMNFNIIIGGTEELLEYMSMPYSGSVKEMLEDRFGIRDAEENAARNGVGNAEFFCGDAADTATMLEAQGLRPDVITVDPPRKGLAPEVIASAAAMEPKRIVYVSCDPGTLGRDVKRFAGLGYRAVRAAAVDMFPGTRHVETVVLLSQQKPDDPIEIDLDLDELDATAAETKATYEEIKAYVWEKHNMKVSSLYISQVKRKCGLEVGQNYNLSKSENPKVPKCPAKKEAAIMDALKHFQMI